MTMSAQIAAPRSHAETALAEAFDAALPALPGGTETRKLREAAFSAFYEAGLPHRRVEAWHYTDLRALMRLALPLAPAPDAAATEAVRELLSKSAPAQRVVLVDGVFAPQLSDPLPSSVKVRSLGAALSDGGPELTTFLAARDFGGTDPIVSLNAALMQDGVVIEIAAGATIVAPIHLVYAFTAKTPSASYSRSAILIGDGASAHIMEERLQVEAAAAGQTNGCLIVRIGDDATFEHAAALSGMGRGSLCIETLIAHVGARAKFNSFALIADGGAVRRQIFLRFGGADAEGSLNGVSLLRGREHADTTLVVEHAAPGCASRETFKYILDEEAVGVFQGRINVEKDAQKTDGRMLSKALLLSDGVVMNNKPELEIFADDVACGHGATCGGLNEDQLFYLQARGIPFTEAEALLLEAFASELVDAVADEATGAGLRAKIAGWLSARGKA